eukprot:jgi/Galph1/4140/GphlegSOOS_G2839.1
MKGHILSLVCFLLIAIASLGIHAAPIGADSSLYDWQGIPEAPIRLTANATAAPTPTVSAGQAEIELGFQSSSSTTSRFADKFGLLPAKQRTVITVTEETNAETLILDNGASFGVIEAEYVGSPSPFAVAFDVILPSNEASSYLSEINSNTTFQDDLRTALALPSSYVFAATQIAVATPTPTVCYTLAAYGQYVPCSITPTPYVSSYSSYSGYSSMPSSYPQVPSYPFIPSF